MSRILRCFAVVLMGSVASLAQSFDVASIKPAAPMTAGRFMIGTQGGPDTPDPAHMTFTNMGLSDLIQFGYDVKSYQVEGPGWLSSARFDIEARVPAGATEKQARVMVQNLLAERFKMVLHHSSKESSVYALLVAKGGPKLKESAPEPVAAEGGADAARPAPIMNGERPAMGKDGFPQLPRGAGGRGGNIMMMAPGGRMRMISNATTIAKFIDALGMQLDRPVVDMTGLTGTYDITLDFAPDPAIMQARMAAMGASPPPGVEGRGPAAGAPDSGNEASLFTALPEQLGLRLEARKGPVDLLVIESALKTPTEN